MWEGLARVIADIVGHIGRAIVAVSTQDVTKARDCLVRIGKCAARGVARCDLIRDSRKP